MGKSRRHFVCGIYIASTDIFVNTQVLEFPEDDIEVNLVPRKIRTEDHVVPEEPYSQVWILK